MFTDLSHNSAVFTALFSLLIFYFGASIYYLVYETMIRTHKT